MKKEEKKYKDIERYRLTRYSLNNELKNGTSLEFFTEKYTNEIIQKKKMLYIRICLYLWVRVSKK